MTRCKRALTLIALTILASTTLFIAAAAESQAATLAAQLRTSRRDLDLARDALAHAQAVPVLIPALPGSHSPAGAAHRFAVHLAKLRVQRFATRVAYLEARPPRRPCCRGARRRATGTRSSPSPRKRTASAPPASTG